MNKEIVEKVKIALLSMQRLSWEQGVTIRAFWELGEKKTAYLLAKEAVHRQKPDGRMAIAADDFISADPGSCGIPCMLIAQEFQDEEMKKAISKMENYYTKLAQRTSCGVLVHFMEATPPKKLIVMIDAIYHLIPFLTATGHVDDALSQLRGFRRLLLNEENKLYHHQFDDVTKTFARSDYWGGGQGWTACACVWMWEYLGENMTAEKQEVANCAKEAIDGMLKFMRRDYFFHDVLDNPNSFVETTGGLMLAFAIFEAIRIGIIDPSYFDVADKIVKASETKIDEFGIVQGAANAPYFRECGTSAEAQAFYLLCVAARERVK